MSSDLDRDIAAIQRIDAVPTILDVVCRTTGMGFAAVARVTEDRWIACQVLDNIAFGLAPGGELKVETTICHEVREAREAVVINHVEEDPVYCGHPTPAMYGFQSYISVPIFTADGSFFGTLCAIDPRPAMLTTPEVVGMFRLFAELIAFHLDALDRLSTSQASLIDERREAELREQFVAVLGHDLRGPLASIQSGTRVLLRRGVDAGTGEILATMQKSVSRMAKLIEDVMDFARGRLGGGLKAVIRPDQPISATLQHVVDECRSGYPERRITTDFADDLILNCDSDRLAQLFANLLSNALHHGAPNTPVNAGAATRAGRFELWVANSGEPIPAQALDRLFQPFQRGTIDGEGLGLGLYIASEIARAHGGKLSVASSAAETRFTFSMPAA